MVVSRYARIHLVATYVNASLGTEDRKTVVQVKYNTIVIMQTNKTFRKRIDTRQLF